MRHSNSLRHVVVLCVTAVLMSTTAQAATIYSDDFSGTGAALNGAAPDVRPGTETWVANSFAKDNGSIDGTVEGGALLPFSPQVNKTYTLSMDVLTPVNTDRWVALGFAQDPISAPGTDQVNDRLSNEPEGIAWMLFRDHRTDNTQDVQVFKGRRTTTMITDDNALFTFGVTHTLTIVLNTTGDGSSFTANFLIDGTAIVNSPITITSLDNPGGGATVPGNLLAQIRYVGFAYDDATSTNAPSVDNFSLTVVPEPAALGLLALGSLLLARRRRA